MVKFFLVGTCSETEKPWEIRKMYEWEALPRKGESIGIIGEILQITEVVHWMDKDMQPNHIDVHLSELTLDGLCYLFCEDPECWGFAAIGSKKEEALEEIRQISGRNDLEITLMEGNW